MISASKMWQSEIKDFDMTNCVDENCNSIANCIAGAQFGCGHFTQQIWKSTTHFCYQARDNIKLLLAACVHYGPWSMDHKLWCSI